MSDTKVRVRKIMTEEKTYSLEYLIDSKQFSNEELKEYVKTSLSKFLTSIDFEIEEHEVGCLILRITSTAKFVDACHDKLDFERTWAFRVNDELGDELRSSAYPILAKIELLLRTFINQAMVEVKGFDWWNSLVPENVRKKTEDVEKRAGAHQVKFHHPIEFTLFEDLIKFVTFQFQEWSDERPITASDLTELLSECNSIEEVQQKINERRKSISIWDDIFSNYFDDKETWSNAKERLETAIIPIRNKVMHHRLMRKFELEKLEDFNEEITQIIDQAKPTLSDVEIDEASQNIGLIFESLASTMNQEALNIIQQSLINSSLFEEFNRGYFISPDIFSELIPKIDMSKLTTLFNMDLVLKPLVENIPKIDMSGLLPQIDTSKIIPRINLSWDINLSSDDNSSENINNQDSDENDGTDSDQNENSDNDNSHDGDSGIE